MRFSSLLPLTQKDTEGTKVPVTFPGSRLYWGEELRQLGADTADVASELVPTLPVGQLLPHTHTACWVGQSKAWVLIGTHLDGKRGGWGFIIVTLSKERREINDKHKENYWGSCVENKFAF